MAGYEVDWVICNPPYVAEEEYEALERELQWEPREALVAGTEGTEFYRRLAEELPVRGLWLEIGATQAAEIAKIFCGWSRCEIMKDRSERERFIFLERD